MPKDGLSQHLAFFSKDLFISVKMNEELFLAKESWFVPKHFTFEKILKALNENSIHYVNECSIRADLHLLHNGHLRIQTQKAA